MVVWRRCELSLPPRETSNTWRPINSRNIWSTSCLPYRINQIDAMSSWDMAEMDKALESCSSQHQGDTGNRNEDRGCCRRRQPRKKLARHRDLSNLVIWCSDAGVNSGFKGLGDSAAF